MTVTCCWETLVNTVSDRHLHKCCEPRGRRHPTGKMDFDRIDALTHQCGACGVQWPTPLPEEEEDDYVPNEALQEVFRKRHQDLGSVKGLITALTALVEIYPDANNYRVAVTDLVPMFLGGDHEGEYRAVTHTFGPPVLLVGHDKPFILLGTGEKL